MESSEAGDDPRRSPPPMAGAVRYAILHPKRTCLRRRLRVKDAAFLDFASKLLCVDPTLRFVFTHLFSEDIRGGVVAYAFCVLEQSV